MATKKPARRRRTPPRERAAPRPLEEQPASQLRRLAYALGIPGHNRLPKATLIEAIREHRRREAEREG